MTQFKFKPPFHFMEYGTRTYKTSNAVGQDGRLLTQTPTRLHLIILRKAAPGMARRRLRHTLVGMKVEVGVDSIFIRNLGKSRIPLYTLAFSMAHTNFSREFI